MDRRRTHGRRIRPHRRHAAPPSQAGRARNRRAPAEALHPDDGPRLRSGAFGRLAEAADLPHLDLRLRECGGRQAPLRGRHRQAPGRRRGPRLFALQRPEPGDPRGPARPLGGCRGRAQLLLRHVGDRHLAARLRPAGRRRRPFGPALRRDRDPDRPHPRPVRRQLARFPGRRDRGRDRRRGRAGQGQGPRPAHLSRKPGQPDQRSGRCRGGGARCATRCSPRASARRSRSTTPSSARSGRSRCATAPTSQRLQPDQICRRPFAIWSRAGSPARRS